ncbi:adenylosuccinate lyase [Candidatus Woesearchaeota archaeon]|nr:adenylosuccinate lyase [Candidatus Woesearchaeota archaeon]
MDPLTAVSPIDGRYHKATQHLQNYFSEFALFKYRIFVEIKYLEFLSEKGIIRKFTETEKASLESIIDSFSQDECTAIKEIEKQVNHDVKAVEYYLKLKLEDTSLKNVVEFIHFGLTSEDVNNIAYAMMIKNYKVKITLPNVLNKIKQYSDLYALIPMLSRTHGQPASPTTLGKEFAVFASRLNVQLEQLQEIKIRAKLNGATGTYASFMSAYPEVDWINFSRDFVISLGFEPNLVTTQIEPHDWMAEVFHCMMRANNILLDFSKDMWTYISIDYLKQKTVAGEVGSSTMPHKVNPIDFENAEGNLGMANAVFEYLSSKLPISRLQRDLSDSTVLRNIGVGFAYSEIAYSSLLKGLGKIEVNREKIKADLSERWELLAEPYQQVFRRYGVTNAYELLKDLTRGKQVTKYDFHGLLDRVNIPEDAKQRLRTLTPETYIGEAGRLARM